jgi:hypothetical protein
MMLVWDAMPDVATPAALAVLDRILRIRTLIMQMIGWPKPPTMRGHLPRALAGTANHNPLGDVDIESMSVTPVAPPVAPPVAGEQ